MSTRWSTIKPWIAHSPTDGANRIEPPEIAQRQHLLQHERNLLRQQVRSLNRRVQEVTRAFDELAGNLVSAQEEERARIARELHDDLGQRTALLEFHVARLAQVLDPLRPEAERELALIGQQARLLSVTIREVCHRLHPSVLSDLGLCAAINQLVEGFAANGVAFTLHTPSVVHDVPTEIAVPVYRIAQEALHNAVKHAPGAPVTVVLQQNPKELRLTVKDAGPGFDLEQARSRARGLGLLSMRERARLVGGSLVIRTAPGNGTVLIASVPFQRYTSSP